MPETGFVALLRGINVGGKNIIAMSDLARSFEELGYRSVRAYIQSGNVVFGSTARSIPRLTAAIERELADRFSYNARVVVLSAVQYRAVLEAAPSFWGRGEDRKHNALFTLAGLTPEKILENLPTPKPRIERVGTGPGVLFWSASKKEISKTTIIKLGRSPLCEHLTVRNHRTVARIGELLAESF